MRRKLRPLARREAPNPILLGTATIAGLLAFGASAQAAPFVYVTNTGGDSVLQYDVGTGGLLSPLSPPTVAAGNGAGAVAVSPDGESVYVSNGGDSTVSQYSVGADGALSPKSPATVAAGSNFSNISGPTGLAITPDGQSFYVADHGYFRGGGGLLKYSVGAHGALTSPTIALESSNPAKVAVSPDGQSVYVTSPEFGSILQYDVGPGGELSFKHPAYVAAGVYAAALAVSPDGQSVYASDTGQDPLGGSEPAAILQYDVGAGGKLSPKSPAEVPTGDGPGAVAVSPDGRSVYATSRDGGAVFQYDVGSGGELSAKSPTTVAAAGASGVAVDQDGQSVYVTNGSSVLQYDIGAGGKLSPKSPPAVAAAGASGVVVSPMHPETAIVFGPSGATTDPTPAFTFISEPGASFRCMLDSGPYSACSSPKTTSHLADGPHTFYVRAKDSDGNVDPTPASRTFTVRTASVGVSGSALVVTAAPGAKDNLQITRPSASIVRVTDFPAGVYAGSGVHTGFGCTRSGDYTANCLASAITPALPALVTSAGQQGDKVVNLTKLPSSLYGGAGDDVLVGGPAGDILNGGAGADMLQGLDGNDLLRAHDGASDQTIDCGAGSDKADLDLLPADPNVQGCEAKTRH